MVQEKQKLSGSWLASWNARQLFHLRRDIAPSLSMRKHRNLIWTLWLLICGCHKVLTLAFCFYLNVVFLFTFFLKVIVLGEVHHNPWQWSLWAEIYHSDRSAYQRASSFNSFFFFLFKGIYFMLLWSVSAVGCSVALRIVWILVL